MIDPDVQAEIEARVASSLADLITTHEEGPQPLLPSDPDCPCERGPFDLRERGVQRVPVRLHMRCPRHGLDMKVPIRVEIRRVPTP